MNRYLCVLSVDIYAADPEQAAHGAWQLLQSTRPVMQVQQLDAEQGPTGDLVSININPSVPVVGSLTEVKLNEPTPGVD